MLQPQLNYNLVKSVPNERTIFFVNNFIINTVQFLNKFSNLCEKKLNDVSKHIRRLEITLSILEAKLSSIPGLDAGGSAPTTAPNTVQTPGEPNGADAGNPPAPPPPPGPTAAPEPIAEQDPNVITYKKDPRYSKYFTMINVGVPESSVRQRMMIDGLNPDILDTPDAPSGSSASEPAPKKAPADDFSDDSNEENDDWD
eukprot:TRINITY_DN2990_c0_g1_i1.p1 TRINITY_DN2990_c0_g1~~TRINITY_DN2990_c0_g1_i1.p1  ORF type:complete len:199 (-),score=41.93 TRINITY_DN2990_c0_g1_i1:243-839(-)